MKRTLFLLLLLLAVAGMGILWIRADTIGYIDTLYAPTSTPAVMPEATSVSVAPNCTISGFSIEASAHAGFWEITSDVTCPQPVDVEILVTTDNGLLSYHLGAVQEWHNMTAWGTLKSEVCITVREAGQIPLRECRTATPNS